MTGLHNSGSLAISPHKLLRVGTHTPWNSFKMKQQSQFTDKAPAGLHLTPPHTHAPSPLLLLSRIGLNTSGSHLPQGLCTCHYPPPHSHNPHDSLPHLLQAFTQMLPLSRPFLTTLLKNRNLPASSTLHLLACLIF